MKGLEKQAHSLVAQKKFKEAKELLPQYYKALDKASKTGVIKQNKAARKKSQAALLLNRVSRRK